MGRGPLDVVECGRGGEEAQGRAGGARNRGRAAARTDADAAAGDGAGVRQRLADRYGVAVDFAIHSSACADATFATTTPTSC